jgi:predicted Zn-dependent protease
MEADAKEGGGMTGESLDAMRAVWIVETGDCSVPPRAEATRARDRFARGLCALGAGDAAAARRELEAMRASPPDKESHEHAGMGYRESRDAEIASVLAKELEAKIASATGDAAGAARLAGEAAAAGDAMTFDFGPPPVVKPAHELAGEVLLAAGRPADARREFDAALRSAPGRSLSLLGLARSADASGDVAAAKDARARLAVNWRRADPGLPGAEEALATGGR